MGYSQAVRQGTLTPHALVRIQLPQFLGNDQDKKQNILGYFIFIIERRERYEHVLAGA